MTKIRVMLLTGLITFTSSACDNFETKKPEDEYGWREASQSEVKKLKESISDTQLHDPFSVEFRGVYVNEGGVHDYCGELNAKNRYGAYVGWTYFHRYYRKGGGTWGMLSLNDEDEIDGITNRLEDSCVDSPLLRNFSDEALDAMLVYRSREKREEKRRAKIEADCTEAVKKLADTYAKVGYMFWDKEEIDENIKYCIEKDSS